MEWVWKLTIEVILLTAKFFCKTKDDKLMYKPELTDYTDFCILSSYKKFILPGTSNWKNSLNWKMTKFRFNHELSLLLYDMNITKRTFRVGSGIENPLLNWNFDFFQFLVLSFCFFILQKNFTVRGITSIVSFSTHSKFLF